MKKFALSFAFLLTAVSTAGAVLPPAPEARTTNGVPHVSGGVGEFQRSRLQSTSGQYNLKAVFSLSRGAYLADVEVAVRDRKGNVLMETISDGPWFFANLPPGEYQIAATALNKTIERTVRVGAGEQRVIHFSGWDDGAPMRRAAGNFR